MKLCLRYRLWHLADRIALEVPDSPLPRQMRSQLDDALEEMRRVINDLHPSVLETMGFLPALENLLTMVASDSNIETCYINKVSNNLELAEFTKLQLYRDVQEALNNVKKHANATIVELSIARTGNNLEISITDNGKGINDTMIGKDLLNKDSLNTRAHHKLIHRKPAQPKLTRPKLIHMDWLNMARQRAQ